MSKKVLLILIICTLIGLERLYNYRNEGFSIANITSSLPPELAPLSAEESQQIDPLLNQPFRLIGSGGTSYVFLGADGNTILKLFKHQHLQPSSLFFATHLPSVFDLWRIQAFLHKEKKHQHKRQPFFFNSCKLAYDHLKEETGLLFLCLKPNQHFARPIQLIDAWGISHSFDLSHTEFALQKKADLLFPHLDALYEQQRYDEIKGTIDAVLTLIRTRCAQGIADRDPNLFINFGLVDNRVIEFDLGSYYENLSLSTPLATAKELFFSTYALQKWLEKHSPDLLDYLLKQITTYEIPF